MTKHFGCINFICYVEEEDKEKKDQILNNILADLMVQFMEASREKGIKVLTGGYHETGGLPNVCADCKDYKDKPEDWQND